MKSVFVRELEEFAIRLKEDGYPTAIVERAAERMQQLEEEIIRLHNLEADSVAERSNN